MGKFNERVNNSGNRVIQVENGEEVKTTVIVKNNGVVQLNQTFGEDRYTIYMTKEEILALADQIKEGE